MDMEKCLFCGRPVEVFSSHSQSRRRVLYNCGACGDYAIPEDYHDYFMYAVQAFAHSNKVGCLLEISEKNKSGVRAYFRREALFKPYC